MKLTKDEIEELINAHKTVDNVIVALALALMPLTDYLNSNGPNDEIERQAMQIQNMISQLKKGMEKKVR